MYTSRENRARSRLVIVSPDYIIDPDQAFSRGELGNYERGQAAAIFLVAP
jgi:hypothetical protein